MARQELLLKTKDDFDNWYADIFCSNLNARYEYPINSVFPEDYPCIVKWSFNNYKIDNGFKERLTNGEKCFYYRFYYKDDFDFSFDNLKYYTKNDLLNEN